MSNLTEDAIQKIADLGEQAEAARIQTLDNGAVVLTTPGVENFTFISSPTKDAHGLLVSPPSRIRLDGKIQTATSLIDYIKKYKTDGTMLFADIARNAIKAVLDFHETPDRPGHGGHAVTLVLPYSEEWKTWTERHGKLTDQLEFARFLRENKADIERPDAATLIEVAKSIQAIRKVNFTQAVKDLNSDNENFDYQDETNASTRGSLAIPEEFAMRLPVYFDGETTELRAWLRWKLEDAKLGLGFTLYRAEHVRQAMFKKVAADIAEAANVPIVYGSNTH